jgi:hypothetical protein
MKMQADLEKARRAEERGDLDAAEKFYNSAEDRKNRLDAANISAASAGQATRFEKEAIERVMTEKGVDFATALQMVRGAGRTETVEVQKDKAALEAIGKRLLMLDPKKDAEEYKRLQSSQAAIMNRLQGGGANSMGGGNIDASNPLLK